MTRLGEAVAPARLGVGYRWLLGSQWVTNLGDGIALTAAPLLVASLTRDPLLVAAASLLQRLPAILFGLYAGAIADRLDRRRIIAVTNVLRTLVLAGLVAVIVTDRVDVAVVLIALFALGTAEIFVDVAAGALLPMLVEPADLGIANARLAFGLVTLNQLAGPALGAVLFAVAMGLPFGVQAVGMALGAVFVSRIVVPAPRETRSPSEESADAPGVLHEIVEGCRWLWHHAVMRTLALAIIAFNVPFAAATSLLVLLSFERLGLDDVGFGILTTTSALGGVLGTALYGRAERTLGIVLITRIGFLIETTTHLVFATTTTAWIAMVMFFLFGMHASMWFITLTSVRQRAVPDRFQGRVGSVYQVGSQAGLVLGTVIGGVIASIWTITAAYWFAFGASLIVLILVWPRLDNIAEPT